MRDSDVRDDYDDEDEGEESSFVPAGGDLRGKFLLAGLIAAIPLLVIVCLEVFCAAFDRGSPSAEVVRRARNALEPDVPPEPTFTQAEMNAAIDRALDAAEKVAAQARHAAFQEGQDAGIKMEQSSGKPGRQLAFQDCLDLINGELKLAHEFRDRGENLGAALFCRSALFAAEVLLRTVHSPDVRERLTIQQSLLEIEVQSSNLLIDLLASIGSPADDIRRVRDTAQQQLQQVRNELMR